MPRRRRRARTRFARAAITRATAARAFGSVEIPKRSSEGRTAGPSVIARARGLVLRRASNAAPRRRPLGRSRPSPRAPLPQASRRLRATGASDARGLAMRALGRAARCFVPGRACLECATPRDVRLGVVRSARGNPRNSSYTAVHSVNRARSSRATRLVVQAWAKKNADLDR